jgi:hypothetical protein
MSEVTEANQAHVPAAGPVVIAYDGSDLSQLAITEAGALLSGGREALVACVWQPFDLGFVPVDAVPFNAEQIPDVRAAAKRTAEAGVALAQSAGFRARSLEIEAAPIWKGGARRKRDRARFPRAQRAHRNGHRQRRRGGCRSLKADRADHPPTPLTSRQLLASRRSAALRTPARFLCACS